MTDPKREPFAGIETRKPRPDSLERAHRNMRRFYRNERLAQKLDEVLGTEEEEES